jgi:hypothetical protein
MIRPAAFYMSRPSILLTSLLACIAFGILSTFEPLLAVVTVGIIILALLPRIGYAAFLLLLIIIPIFNPSVVRAGETGRLYLSHFLMGISLVSASFQLPFRPVDTRILVAVACGVAYGLIGFVGSDLPMATAAAWAYRPMQPFLMLLIAWLYTRRAEVPERLFLLGALIGTALATANVVSPVDLFAMSRPADLPWRSLIGGYERAHGAFTYSNNLAQYAAYSGIFALSIWLDPKSQPLRGLARLTAASCLLAILATLSRAALGGFLIAGIILILGRGSEIRLRSILLISILISTISFAVVSDRSIQSILAERVSQIDTGLSIRFNSWKESLNIVLSTPIFGVGTTVSRLDSTYLLMVMNAGITGTLLLIGASIALWRMTRNIDNWHHRAVLALAILFLSSGLLQDNLGQTLSSWALAVSYVLIVRSGQRSLAEKRQKAAV